MSGGALNRRLGMSQWPAQRRGEQSLPALAQNSSRKSFKSRSPLKEIIRSLKFVYVFPPVK